jgi:23S rRNA pseudouridine955/2504/2580 synthase
MKLFEIGENDAGQRLDKFVRKVTLGLPTSLLYKAIRTKKIKVNRKRCEAGQILNRGDSVQLFLSPEFFGEEEHPWMHLTPVLSVVYEDDNLIICDKPIGLSCHGDQTQKTGTLIDHIKGYLHKKGEFCPEKEHSFAPALCNRIDRSTTGLVICAKNFVALQEMNEMIRQRQVQKEYLAWVLGPWEKSRTVKVFLKKDDKTNTVRVSPVEREGYLTAITEAHPVFYDKEKGRQLLRILLHTGRTHQIRATMAYLGTPLVGDSKYGKDRAEDFRFQALRAHKLSFSPKDSSPLFYLKELVVTAPEDDAFCPKK